jgi:hypothetical protein
VVVREVVGLVLGDRELVVGFMVVLVAGRHWEYPEELGQFLEDLI